jgi:hypothetical protein
MMTTCAAIAGALPLAIATGDGTEMRRPLGIAIVGGLIVSQLLDGVHHAGGVPVRAPLLETSQGRQVLAARGGSAGAESGVGGLAPLRGRHLIKPVTAAPPVGLHGASPARSARRLRGRARLSSPAFDSRKLQGAGTDWKPSEPSDALSRGPWWKIFNDDTLNELEAQDRHFE